MSNDVIFCRWADIVVGSVVVKPIGINQTVELKVIKKEIDEEGFIQVWYEKSDMNIDYLESLIDRFNFYKSQVVVKKREIGENTWGK